MESSVEKPGECSLKIDTVWSEADESIFIKEEIVSDVEAESVNSTPENSNNYSNENQSDKQGDEEDSCHKFPEAEIISTWQPLKRKKKNKFRRDESESIVNYKLTCAHDSKNFKIVKRRLRCGDCRSLVCPECCKVMIPNLQSHFLGSGLCNSGTFLCKLCSIIFHSLCALQAHIRIHTMDTPYVCPDCGLIYNNMYFLILHLLNKCYHVYKIVRYKCKHCPGAYFTPESFVQHIQEKHINCVFRCLYCSSLFSNYEEFNFHMENLHQKQKVQYLNYFRCTLCSNMVVPRFMYQQHVAQHRENSEFYEVDYQCLCGETHNMIGTFRTHFLYCNKKGILPPKWSFLQKKLRTHDLIHPDNFRSKEVRVKPLPLASNNQGNFQKMTLLRLDDDDKSMFHRGNLNFCVKGNFEQSGQNQNPEIVELDNEKEEETSKNLNGSCKSVLNSSKGSDESLTEVIAPEIYSQPEVEISISESTPVLEENCTKTVEESVGGENTEGNVYKSVKETEEPKGDISKIYDHIPCDHLGYVVKTQGPGRVVQSQENDNVVEKLPSPTGYKIVTELDEKTGIMTTKTVPLDPLEPEDVEEVIDEDNADADSVNMDSTPKQLYSEKAKCKLGNFLNCPFCIVLFPKHNLTFQRFRLHLESHHPDAALNVTVDKNTEETPEKNVSEKDTQEESNDTSKNSEQSTNLPSTDNFESQDSTTEIQEPTQTEVVESSDQNKECNPVEENKNDDIPQENKEENSESKESEDRDVEILPQNQPSIEKPSDHNDDEKEEKKETTEELKDSDENLEEVVEEIPKPEKIEDSLNKSNPVECEEKVTSKSCSELEYEEETSKDSNWSLISDKDTKVNSSNESKTEEKERSRRESEVWSEFYESLMMAEKFKKKKNPSPESESQKKSVVSDYSSKRIVKKPKRYRESSESLDSNEGSESDEDFLFDNDFMNELQSEEKNKADDQPSKKQMLLSKLEKVDGKFVDYLFDLVTKKEKLFELYEKHSTLRANRYSHDLRSYRKKVLNGIKQRGRPIKILRYHELLRKRGLGGEQSKEGSQTKKIPIFFSDFKIAERKRGRPRKYDSVKIKERRRSDKEVDFIERNFDNEELDISPSKRKRKLSSKLQYYKRASVEKDDFSSGQVITNKPVDSNKNFTCAVCKESFQEVTDFRQHIPIHRMEENTYQCLECGECFVVRPSLEKHLHAFHKIKNTQKYITDNLCPEIKKEEVEETIEPLKENQCKVCKDQFDKPSDLTKHFRIHGMAFLKEFKKDGKSCEKRNM